MGELIALEKGSRSKKSWWCVGCASSTLGCLFSTARAPGMGPPMLRGSSSTAATSNGAAGAGNETKTAPSVRREVTMTDQVSVELSATGTKLVNQVRKRASPRFRDRASFL